MSNDKKKIGLLAIHGLGINFNQDSFKEFLADPEAFKVKAAARKAKWVANSA